MAYFLKPEKRVAIIRALVEGNSVRSVERMTGVHRDTIIRLMVRVGQGCETLLDRMMVGLPCETLQIDHIWSYVRKRQEQVTEEDPKTVGDVWVWFAIDSRTKLVPAFLVGKHDPQAAIDFVKDVSRRIAPGVLALNGGLWAPTSQMERQNLTMRTQIRRFTQLTNGFSKKLENHRAAVALHFGHYNLVRTHRTLRTTPAVQAGLQDHVWGIDQLINTALSGRIDLSGS